MLPVSGCRTCKSRRDCRSAACAQLSCELIWEEADCALQKLSSAHRRCSGALEGRAFPCNLRVVWAPCWNGFFNSLFCFGEGQALSFTLYFCILFSVHPLDIPLREEEGCHLLCLGLMNVQCLSALQWKCWDPKYPALFFFLRSIRVKKH